MNKKNDVEIATDENSIESKISKPITLEIKATLKIEFNHFCIKEEKSFLDSQLNST